MRDWLIALPGLSTGLLEHMPACRAVGEAVELPAVFPDLPQKLRNTYSFTSGAAGPRADLFWSDVGDAEVSLVRRVEPVDDDEPRSTLADRPSGLAAELTAHLGRPFPHANFHGPLANLESSRWIAEAAGALFDMGRASVVRVAMPHLLFGSQRWGPESDRAIAEAVELDDVLAALLDRLRAGGSRVRLLGGPTMFPVVGAAFPNRVLRSAGLLSVVEDRSRELVDMRESRAWARVDHQVAFVSCSDPESADRAANALLADEGVDRVERTGSTALTAVAKADRWFAYYWWNETGKAPPFARWVDPLRRMGEDPMELFINPRIKAIDFNVERIKGSYGRGGRGPLLVG